MRAIPRGRAGPGASFWSAARSTASFPAIFLPLLGGYGVRVRPSMQAAGGAAGYVLRYDVGYGSSFIVRHWYQGSETRSAGVSGCRHSAEVDRAAVEEWIRAHVDPVDAVQTAHERPWATVLRVPLTGGVAWFKACAAVQSFEPRLTAQLFARWPDRVAEVLGHEDQRGWLLLADAGVPIGVYGNPPQAWLAALPAYAELQRGEAAYTEDHLRHGVPDLRLVTLPARYQDLLAHDLPLEAAEIDRLRRFAARFAELCGELAGYGLPETVQHDDLHMANLYVQHGRMRVLDWGDASISHPFASLVVTFRFLEEVTKLPPDDPWFARLRDAYLEPWGSGLTAAFALAIRVGSFAHAVAWARQRDHLPEHERREFDRTFSIVLRRAVAQTVE